MLIRATKDNSKQVNGLETSYLEIVSSIALIWKKTKRLYLKGYYKWNIGVHFKNECLLQKNLQTYEIGRTMCKGTLELEPYISNV